MGEHHNHSGTAHVGRLAGIGIWMSVFTHPGPTARSLQLRTYLTGIGATAALIAGALLAFLSLASFLAFKGLPSGTSSGTAGTAYLDSVASSGAPTAAGAALGAAQAAVARNPVPRFRGGGARASGGGSHGLGGAPVTPPSAPVILPPGAVPGPSSSTGPVESGVSYLNQATSSPGVTVPSGPASTADGASRSTLNSAQPGLGGQVSNSGSSLVNGLPQP